LRFVLLVEGETESKVLPAFFKRWLDPRLSTPVGIKPVKFQGWSDLCQGVKTKANTYLNGPDKDEIIAVISLLDLYGITYVFLNRKNGFQNKVFICPKEK